MNRHTHVLFALALTAWLFKDVDLPALTIALTSSAIGSVLPDLDLSFKHRKTLHNVFALALLALLVYTVVPRWLCPGTCVIGFITGWGSHILLDALTKKGVGFFYPISSYHFRVGLCRSDSPLCNMFFTVLSIVFIVIRVLS